MQKDYVENFAYKVFDVADNQDRSGHPTKYFLFLSLLILLLKQYLCLLDSRLPTFLQFLFVRSPIHTLQLPSPTPLSRSLAFPSLSFSSPPNILARDTAKSFFAAAQFFEVLKQFGEVDIEVSEP
jgi:hypothetical protein